MQGLDRDHAAGRGGAGSARDPPQQNAVSGDGPCHQQAPGWTRGVLPQDSGCLRLEWVPRVGAQLRMTSYRASVDGGPTWPGGPAQSGACGKPGLAPASHTPLAPRGPTSLRNPCPLVICPKVLPGRRVPFGLGPHFTQGSHLVWGSLLTWGSGCAQGSVPLGLGLPWCAGVWLCPGGPICPSDPS